jgi:hypothetical protein
MTYIDFLLWYETIYENDYEYIKNYNYYGFQIQFYKISYYWQVKKIYPQYPWNKNFENIHTKKERNIQNSKLQKKIRIFKNIILKINNLKLIKKLIKKI